MFEDKQPAADLFAVLRALRNTLHGAGLGSLTARHSGKDAKSSSSSPAKTQTRSSSASAGSTRTRTGASAPPRRSAASSTQRGSPKRSSRVLSSRSTKSYHSVRSERSSLPGEFCARAQMTRCRSTSGPAPAPTCCTASHNQRTSGFGWSPSIATKCAARDPVLTRLDRVHFGPG